jgi:hypothetical protein
MPLAPEARAFLNSLSRIPGCRHEGLPKIEGMTGHEVEAMLLDLSERGLIRVDGPPNQNSDLGKDVDTVELTSLGYMTAD